MKGYVGVRPWGCGRVIQEGEDGVHGWGVSDCGKKGGGWDVCRNEGDFSCGLDVS